MTAATLSRVATHGGDLRIDRTPFSGLRAVLSARIAEALRADGEGFLGQG